MLPLFLQRPATRSAQRRISAGAPPSDDLLKVKIGAQEIGVQVRSNPRAKRFILRLDPTGTPILTVPPGTNERAARQMLTRHLGWLQNRLDQIPARIAFEVGATLPIRDEPHEIVRRSARGAPVKLTQDQCRPVLAVNAPRNEVAGRVRHFLIEAARADLTNAAQKAADRAGVQFSRLRINDPKSRWGSCSSLKTLSFSWRLILAPPPVLQYLAAHEVAHLAELNHGPRFWRLCRALADDMDFAKSWLHQHGRALHRYG